MNRQTATLIAILVVVAGTTFWLRQRAKQLMPEPEPQHKTVSKEPEPFLAPAPPTFAATLGEPQVADQTTVYCGTIQLAWNELGDKCFGFPILLSGEPGLETMLNKREFTSNNIDAGSILVHAGRDTEESREALRTELKHRFPKCEALLPPYPDSGGLGWFAFACMEKSLLFPVPFDRLENGILFGNPQSPVVVEAFGLGELDPTDADDTSKAAQVEVLHYGSWKEFILRLKTGSDDEELILAMIPCQKTLRETVDLALKLVAEGEPSQLKEMDEVSIPLIRIDAGHNYASMVGRTILNYGFEGQFIGTFHQAIRFRLDETGATLRSVAEEAALNGHRSFSFSQPFLLMMKRKSTPTPYFAIWIGDTNFLVRRR